MRLSQRLAARKKQLYWTAILFVAAAANSSALAADTTADAFWSPIQEVVSSLELLQSRSAHPAWNAWWKHLEGERLLAMARGHEAVDAGLLWHTCQRLEHATARSEPDFYGLYEAVLDWRVELELPKIKSLPATIRLAAEQETAVQPENDKSLVAATRLAAQRTDLSLRGPYAEAWRDYLMLATLSKLPDSLSVDNRALVQKVYQRTVAGHVGLDQRGVIALRLALARLIAAFESGSEDKSSVGFRERMLALAAALEVLDRGPDPAAERTVSAAVSWLETSSQRRPFAYAARRRYTWPNVCVNVSADFVRKHSVVPFERSEPVYDQIQDISIRGDRTARGQVWMELVSHPAKLSVDLLLKGDFVASTVGHAQRATVFSTTTGEFSARRRVAFDGAAFVMSPVSAIMRQSSRIRCISVDVMRLFQRFALRRAWSEASARRGSVEAISRRHNQAKVEQAFERHSATALERARQNYVKNVWGPLQRYGQMPRRARVATTAQGIEYRALFTDQLMAGAFAPPPAANEPRGVTVQFHESVFWHLAREFPEHGSMIALLANTGSVAQVWSVARQSAPSPDASSEHQLSVVAGASDVQVTFRLPDQSGNRLHAHATYDLRALGRGTDAAAETIEVTLDGQPKPLLASLVKRLLTEHVGLAPKGPAGQDAWWGHGKVSLTGAESSRGWLTLSWQETAP